VLNNKNKNILNILSDIFCTEDKPLGLRDEETAAKSYNAAKKWSYR
jgi:hypothetical protein